MASIKSTSKFISLILRHKPEVIGIFLDEHGWADVEEGYRFYLSANQVWLTKAVPAQYLKKVDGL